MKTLKFLSYTVFVLFLSIAITSCSGDDGATGPAGADGTNGTDGADGADGNANVQTYIFDSPNWTSNVMELNLSAITQEVWDDDLILGYLKLTGANPYWYETSEHYLGGYFRDYISVGVFKIKAHNLDGSSDITPPDIEKVKIIIIESTNTSTITGNGARPVSSKQRIYNELENAGVDINDYYSVCEYYGIDPE